MSTLLAFSVLGTNVLVLASWTALFLGARPRSELPLAYTAAALFGLLASLTVSALSGRVARIREALYVFAALAASLAVSWGLLRALPSWYVFVGYPLCTALSALAIIQGFTIVSDCVDAEQAKRLLPLVGAGGTLGAVLAGGSIAWLAPRIGTRQLLLVASLLLGVSAFAAVRLVAAHVRDAHSVHPPKRSMRPGAPITRWLNDVSALLVREELVRWLAVAQLCLMVASTVLKFELESALQRSLRLDEIAVFLGLFNLGANALVLTIQTFAEGRVLRALGATAGLFATPIVFVALLPVLFASSALLVVGAVRFLEHVARFSIGRTSEDLVVLPLSSVRRRRAKTLVSGALAPIAVLLASLVIVALGASASGARVALAWLFGGMALYATYAMRKPYLDRLRASLSRGRTTLDPLAPSALAAGLAGLDGALEDAAKQGDAKRLSFVLGVVADTKAKVQRERVESLYPHDNPRVREAAFQAAAALGDAAWADALFACFEREQEEQAKLACARALCALLPDERLEELAPLFADASPVIRAEALARRYSAEKLEDHERFSRLVVGDTQEREGLAHALGKLDDTKARSLLEPLLEDTNVEVRRAALTSAARVKDPKHLPLVVAALDTRTLTREAMEVLRTWPPAQVVPALVSTAQSAVAPRRRTLAIQVLGRIRDRSAAVALLEMAIHGAFELRSATLRALVRQRVRGATFDNRLRILKEASRELETIAWTVVVTAKLSTCRAPEERIARARAELQVHEREAQRRLFAWLALIHPHEDMLRAQITLESGDRHARAFALEMLDQRLEPALRKGVLMHFSGRSLEERLTHAEKTLGLAPDESLAKLLATGHGHAPRWLALYLLVTSPASNDEVQLMSLLETMFVLRTVELFSQLATDELRAIAGLAQRTTFPSGTAIFRAGEPGDSFYVILHGEVAVSRDATQIATLRDGECFGELALLDRGVRNATVTARAETEVARINAEDFDDLLDELPSIGRAMLGILARRNARLLDGRG